MQRQHQFAERKVMRLYDIGATPPNVIKITMGGVTATSDACAGKR